MPAYKLTYFNLKIRGEGIRVIFAEAGVDYEDFRIGFNDWPKHKPDMPFGQVPVLMIDGQQLPQSGAIARYLAGEFNLNGATSLEEAYVDMIWETHSEILGKLPYVEQDPEKKEKAINEALKFINPIFQRFEEKFKKKVEKIAADKNQDVKDCHFIGQKFTYADIAVMIAAHEVEGFKEGFIDQFPTVRDHIVRKTEERPKIKAYLAKRPKSDF